MWTIPTEVKLALFQGMLVCAGGPRLSCYDGRFRRVIGDDEAFRTSDALLALCRQGVNLEEFLLRGPEPVLFTGRIGLFWILCPLFSEGRLIRIYALGPCLSENCSSLDFDMTLTYAGASLTLRTQANVLLRSLPLLPYDRIREYATMLYYLVAEERLSPQGIRLLNGGTLPSRARQTSSQDEKQAYAAEREALRRVQEGDLTLRADSISLNDAVFRTKPVGDQLRQMKNAVLTRLALLSRAAIAGGLSLETSYSLWEKYVQSTETAQSKGELANLLQTMQGDFASRVHALKHRRMSPEIETACEYIDQHLQEPMTIEKLASLDGYAEYYFSRKFKRETGMSPAEYIRYKRLQKAASLLVTTDQDVKQIGSSLLFCSHSFFSDCFHRQYGVTPSQYRQAAML